MNRSIRTIHEEQISKDQRNALFERVERLYKDVSETALDVDATLSSNKTLLEETFDFIQNEIEENQDFVSLDRQRGPSFEQALHLLDAMVSSAKSDDNKILFAKANFFSGRLFEAQFDYETALARYDLALVHSDEPHSYVLAAAICARKLCRNELAASYLKSVLSPSGRSGLALLDQCRALNELGALREADLDVEGAIRCLAEAERGTRQLDGHPDLRNRIKNNIGHCLLSNNDPASALPFIRNAHEFFKARRSNNRSDFISVTLNLAEALRKLHEKRLKSSKPFLPELRNYFWNDTDIAEAEEMASKCEGRELDEAEILLYDCLSFSKRSYGKLGPHPHIANSLNSFGVFLVTQRAAVRKGREMVREATDMMESLFTEYNPRLINMLINLGILEGRDDPEDGTRLLNRAELLAGRLFEDDDPIFRVIREEKSVLAKR